MSRAEAARRALLLGAAVVVLAGLAAVAQWVAWLGENDVGLHPTQPDLLRALGVLAANLVPGLLAVTVCLGWLRITEHGWTYRLVAAFTAALLADLLRLVLLVEARSAHPDAWFVVAEAGFGAVVILVAVLLPVYDHDAVARHAREERLRAEEAQRAELAELRAETTELEVRRDLSRRLHGTVQQRLVLAAAEVQALADLEPSAELAARLHAVAEFLDRVREHDVRELSRSLLPFGVDIGLHEALYVALGRLPASVSTTVAFSDTLSARIDDPDRPRLSMAERLLVLDVVEEAVTNAVRHGGARTVTVRLDAEVDDDGTQATFVAQVDNDGSDPREDVRLSGLARLDERAARRHGSVRLARRDGGGARVELRMRVGRPDVDDV